MTIKNKNPLEDINPEIASKHLSDFIIGGFGINFAPKSRISLGMIEKRTDEYLNKYDISQSRFDEILRGGILRAYESYMVGTDEKRAYVISEGNIKDLKVRKNWEKAEKVLDIYVDKKGCNSVMEKIKPCVPRSVDDLLVPARDIARNAFFNELAMIKPVCGDYPLTISSISKLAGYLNIRNEYKYIFEQFGFENDDLVEIEYHGPVQSFKPI